MGGIYQIRNTINGKVYVGCTAKGLDHRKGQHFSALKKGKHCNPYLQRAFDKHGEDAFVFEVLEKCKKELLGERERKYYFEIPEELRYNCKIPDYNIHGGRYTEKTKKKMSGKNNHQFGKRGKDGAFYGRKHTQETREKIAAANRGKNNPQFGKFGKDSKTSKPIKQIDIETGKVIKVFYSAREASKAVGFPSAVSSICKVARGISKHSCGFKWEYVEK